MKFYIAARRGVAGAAAALLVTLSALLGAATAHAEDGFLPPEKAFVLDARMLDPQTVELRYTIADSYYMYRERFSFTAEGATTGAPVFPKGDVHYDETFAKDVESYRKSVAIRLPVKAGAEFTLHAVSQGCSDKGLCYPPMTTTVTLSPAAAPAAGAPAAAGAAGAAPASESGRIETALHSRSLLAILPLFLLLGLGLSFTPCVLPMLPILSSIIVGNGGGGGRARGFALSLSYSLGMALVYTALGVGAGLAGEGLAAALQNPWVLGAFGLLMVALSLSMFGVYQLQMPASIQQRLTGKSNQLAAGRHAGVFAMGALSALVVGPCVAAPLAGALMYISQTRDAMIGGSALFAMAVGMSVPLLLVGASAGALLPRAGAWMEGIKRFFGVLMLGTALWIVSPVIPVQAQMLGWALLGLGYAAWLLRQPARGRVALAGVLLFGTAGAVQLAGVALGATDPLAPFARFAATPHEETAFRRVKTSAELDALLATAGDKTVMLDFYADWCVSCKEMEKFTFSDERVKQQFGRMLLVQADVTANDAADKALLKRFKLFGPPGIIFFAPGGKEIAAARVVGYQDADKFLTSLAAAARP